MKVYFIVGGIASFLAVASLAVILFYMLRKNWNYANRTRFSFIAPVVVTAVLIYVALTAFIPRALDAVSAVSHQYEMAEIDYDAEAVVRNTLTVDGKTFSFSPNMFAEGKGRYQITYTPRTHYIVSVSRLGEKAAP